MNAGKVFYRILTVSVAVVFFSLGFRYALGSPAKVEDIIFSELEEATRLVILTNEDTGLNLSYGDDHKTLTIRLASTEMDEIFESLEYSDELIKFARAGRDEKTGDALVTLTFAKPEIVFYRSPVSGGHGVALDFRAGGKRLRIAGVTPEQLTRRRPKEKEPGPAAKTPPEKETLTKERIDALFAGIEKKYSEMEAESGRSEYIEIMKLIQKKEQAEAVKKADEFIRKYPESVYLERVYFSRADALFEMSKKDPALSKAAMEAYNTAIARYPESRMAEHAMMSRAALYRDQGFYIEALSEYGGLLRRDPKGKYAVAAMLGRARIYLKQQKYQKAYNELERILVLYPTRREVRDVKFIIAASYFERGKYKEAAAIFDESRKLWPTYPKTHPATYMTMAQTYYKVGRLNKAMEDWSAIVNLFPDSYEGREALLRMGDLYTELGLRREAAKIYENVVRRFPDKDEAIKAKLALASLGADDPDILKHSEVFSYSAFEDPLKTFDEILAKYPEKHGPEALMRKGEALYTRKRYVSAILAYKELLRSYPSARMSEEVFDLVRKNLLRLIETFHDQEGFFTVLMTYYDNFDPFLKGIKEPRILLKIANSYKALTLYERAIEYYKLANRHDPAGRFLPVTAFNIASATLEKGDAGNAERMFRRFLKQFKTDKNATLARALLGEALYAQGRQAEAATEWRLALETDPANPAASLTAYKLGELYKKNGRHALAIDAYNRAIATYKPKVETGQDPEYIKDARYKIAESYYLGQDYPGAIREAGRFVSLYPDDGRVKWMDYITSASLSRIDKDEKALARLRELAEKDKVSPIGKVAAARLSTMEWKKKNPDLFFE